MTRTDIDLVLSGKAYLIAETLAYEYIGGDDSKDGYCFVVVENDNLWITLSYDRMLKENFDIVMVDEYKSRHIYY